MSIESLIPSNHLVFCLPLLLLPSVFPSISVFSSESALCIRWPKYWSFSFSTSPFNEYSGLVSFRLHWFDLPAVQATLKSLLQHHSLKASILWCSAFFMVQFSHLYITTGKTIVLTLWIHRLEKLILLKCSYCPKPLIDSRLYLSRVQWHFCNSQIIWFWPRNSRHRPVKQNQEPIHKSSHIWSTNICQGSKGSNIRWKKSLFHKWCWKTIFPRTKGHGASFRMILSALHLLCTLFLLLLHQLHLRSWGISSQRLGTCDISDPREV